MKFNSDLTQERLQEVAHYDIESGIFIARRSRARRRQGDELGTVRQDGYRAIFIDGKWYKAHRLAWLYFYGEWPNGFLDHKNRNKLDNRIENLRVATLAQNNANKASTSKNRSGYRGVRVLLAGKRKPERYVTEIYKDGKKTTLGTFDTLDEALAVRLQAANDLFGEFADSA